MKMQEMFGSERGKLLLNLLTSDIKKLERKYKLLVYNPPPFTSVYHSKRYTISIVNLTCQYLCSQN